MNPLAILTLVIAVVVGFFAISSGGPGLFGGSGPIATGPGSPEIRNPQPLARGSIFSIPRVAVQSPPAPSAGKPTPSAPALPPGVSPYRARVAIAGVQRFREEADQEYVTIRHQGSGGFFSRSGERKSQEPIVVTGWRIESLRSSGVIPRAFNIPEIDAAEQDILLPPGGEVIIVSGTPSYQRNFRENACVGYLNQSHRFTPSLSGSCPDSRRDRSLLLARGFNGACIDAIQAVPACRTPQGPFTAALIKSECIDYLNQNFSYVGCAKNFRDEKDFLRNTWRVFLGRPTKLFDPRHDRVTLRDGQGLLVDEFEY